MMLGELRRALRVADPGLGTRRDPNHGPRGPKRGVGPRGQGRDGEAPNGPGSGAPASPGSHQGRGERHDRQVAALVCGAAPKGFATVNEVLTPTPAPIE